MPSLSSASALEVAADTVASILANVNQNNENSGQTLLLVEESGGVVTTRMNLISNTAEFQQFVSDLSNDISLNNNATFKAALSEASSDGVVDAQELQEILVQHSDLAAQINDIFLNVIRK